MFSFTKGQALGLAVSQVVGCDCLYRVWLPRVSNGCPQTAQNFRLQPREKNRKTIGSAKNQKLIPLCILRGQSLSCLYWDLLKARLWNLVQTDCFLTTTTPPTPTPTAKVVNEGTPLNKHPLPSFAFRKTVRKPAFYYNFNVLLFTSTI